MKRETIEKALKDLVAIIYNDCIGAYGALDGNTYEGQYEREIQNLVKALIDKEA